MGAALARTGLDRRTPLATATLVIAANAPDVDVLSYVEGPYHALACRRGITHGLPAQLLLPFAVAAAVLAWDRWVRRRRDPTREPVKPSQVLLLSFLGVLTHPALDWLNVYGMRWGLPFSGTWSYGDTLFIIDPWLWLLLGGAVLLAGPGRPWLWGILGALTTTLMVVAPLHPLAKGLWLAGVVALTALRLMRWPASGEGGRALTRFALAASVAYMAGMGTAGALGAREVRAEAEAQGLEPSQVMLSPAPANPFLREVEVVTPAGYVPGVHGWLRTPRVTLRPADVVSFLRYPADVEPATVEAVLAAARRHPDVANYLVWARYPYAVVQRDGDGWFIRYSDARYDDRDDAGGLGGVTVRVPALP